MFGEPIVELVPRLRFKSEPKAGKSRLDLGSFFFFSFKFCPDEMYLAPKMLMHGLDSRSIINY